MYRASDALHRLVLTNDAGRECGVEALDALSFVAGNALDGYARNRS